MRVAEGVEALELTMNFMGGPSTIHPTLVWDEKEAILIDTGMPGQLGALRDACARAGVPLERLTRVVLTHQDIDHIGGLPELLDAVGDRVEVLAHPVDRPYIEGEKTPIKMDPERWKERLSSLPAEQRAQAESILSRPPKGRVDRTVEDGEVLPYCGGVTVVHTPGHTPGHISLYLHASRTLIAGDALVSDDGTLHGPRPGATPDMATAERSLAKLTPFALDRIITYHGGLVDRDAQQQLRELAPS